MWNVTGSDVWRQRTQSLLDATGYFFTSDQIMTEAACEPMLNCNIDQPAFKAFLARWMAASTKVAPWTYDFVMERLKPSAVGAAKSCTGGASGTICGQRWYTGTWDGTNGVGQQLSALEVVMAAGLINEKAAPVTNTTGGTSQGDYLAGTGTSENIYAEYGHYHITGECCFRKGVPHDY
jgi:mannan endo-1,6-alpha-mannosidase